MKNMPEISIIVPVYNAEDYLVRCLDSIKKQNFTEWECILVNDGSTDNSVELCNRYADEDSRFKVINKNNGGVSSARNVGLDVAVGTWIAFVDSDDFVDPDYLTIPESLRNCDIVQKSYTILKKSEQTEIPLPLRDGCVLKDRDSLCRFFLNKRNNALWDKIFKRTLVGDCRFDTSISIGEDFMFQTVLMQRVNLYGFSDAGKYVYVIRDDSAMSNIEGDITKRLRVVEENIHHVDDIVSSKESFYLHDGLIYGTYIPFMLKCKRRLNDGQHVIVDSRIKVLKFGSLKLLSFERKKNLLFLIFKYYINKILRQ